MNFVVSVKKEAGDILDVTLNNGVVCSVCPADETDRCVVVPAIYGDASPRTLELIARFACPEFNNQSDALSFALHVIENNLTLLCEARGSRHVSIKYNLE